MGEVYRARDTRLDRTVAVKVLPAAFANDAQLRLRFEREAKAISSLAHPNICTLYDVGQQDGVDYLVMEYLDGQTLADRIVKGPLPVEQALAIGVQIADALDKAHRQGIVHRDLKPGNIMLTKNGAKLLDFGLAKYGTQPEIAGSLTVMPTQQKPLTQEGTILGTFQYMAPEQLEGSDADARTDLFALGAVLYEMLTGRRAFQGKSKASLIAAILQHEPPPISSIQPLSPPALDRLIRICLAKDPDDRWQTAHDVLLQLKWIGEGGSLAGVPAPVARHRRHRERLATVALVLAVIATLTFAALWYGVAGAPQPVLETAITPPEKSTFSSDSGSMVLSPDGTRIVLSVEDGTSKRSLWMRPLDHTVAQPLAGTENGNFPFWSPDGRVVGFFTGGKLRRVNAAGGPVQLLADVVSARGGTWNKNDVIVYAPATNDSLSKISAAGGTPVRLTELDKAKNESAHRFPVFLPDQDHIVFLSLRNGGGFRIESSTLEIVSLHSGERITLGPADSSAIYAPPGYLLFRRNRTLVAQPFDAKKLRFTGEAIPIVEDVRVTSTFQALVTASPDGKIAYQTGGPLGQSQLMLVDRSGKLISNVGPPADYRSPVLSHDGRRIAVMKTEANAVSGDIWTIDLARGTSTRMTFDPSNDVSPLWSPDDSRIIFTSNRRDLSDVYVKPASGLGTDEPLIVMDGFTAASDWSLDGRYIAFQNNPPDTKRAWDIWIYSVAEKKAFPFLQTEFGETSPHFSPDGKWLVYASDESGRNEVYVQPFPATGGKWQISTEGGFRPKWSARGDEIFYVANSKMMAVKVKTGPTFEAGVPETLFEGHAKGGPDGLYAPTADGQRFIINSAVRDESHTPITLVQNWYQRR